MRLPDAWGGTAIGPASSIHSLTRFSNHRSTLVVRHKALNVSEKGLLSGVSIKRRIRYDLVLNTKNTKRRPDAVLRKDQ
jgi:hypothetical protein